MNASNDNMSMIITAVFVGAIFNIAISTLAYNFKCNNPDNTNPFVLMLVKHYNNLQITTLLIGLFSGLVAILMLNSVPKSQVLYLEDY